MAFIKKSALALILSVILVLLIALPVMAQQWSIETVDSGFRIGRYTSIALDDSGYPHISYYDSDDDDLEYASWTGSDWETQTVDEAGNVGEFCSLAIDDSNRPHISYFDYDNDDLKYACDKNGNGAFNDAGEIVIVDDAHVGKHTSLALDGNGHPHISYANPNGTLKYAGWNGTAWNVETVDDGGDGVISCGEV